MFTVPTARTMRTYAINILIVKNTIVWQWSLLLFPPSDYIQFAML